MLLLLVTHPGKVYSRENLLHAIWGEDIPGMPGLLTCISAGCGRRLSRTPASQDMCCPSGASDIIINSSGCIDEKNFFSK